MSRKAFKDHFQKKYKGEEVVQYDTDNKVATKAILTGIYSFDIASGIGGFPKSRVVEIYGPESGGKTLLSLVALGYAQRMFGATGLYFDLEGSTPQSWLETIGIQLDKLDIIPGGLSAEECLDTVVAAIRDGEYSYIIIDSVAGLIPRAELEGEITKDYVGTVSRVMSKGLRKIVSTLSSTSGKGPCVIFINQTRQKIGVMFGTPETTPGGLALKFYSAQRYRVSRDGPPKKDKSGAYGHNIKVVNKKNKLAPPSREGSFFVHYTEGVDTVKVLMRTLKDQKLYSREKMSMPYILVLGDEQIEFAKVSDIESKLRADDSFHQKVYSYLLSRWEDSHMPTSLDDEDEEEGIINEPNIEDTNNPYTF